MEIFTLNIVYEMSLSARQRAIPRFPDSGPPQKRGKFQGEVRVKACKGWSFYRSPHWSKPNAALRWPTLIDTDRGIRGNT